MIKIKRIGIVLRILSLLLATLTISIWAEEKLTAEQVVQNVKKVYSQIESYEDTGKRTVVMAGVTTTMECNLVYKTPNKVYHTMGDTKVICDGNTQWTYNPVMNQYTEEEAPERLGGNFMATPILSLLMGQEETGLTKGWNNDPTSWVLQIGELESKEVYIIEVPSKGGGKQTFWIGKQDFLIYKLRSSEVMKMPTGESGSSMTITEVHNNIKINKEISEDNFAFIPPEGAKLVPSYYP